MGLVTIHGRSKCLAICPRRAERRVLLKALLRRRGGAGLSGGAGERDVDVDLGMSAHGGVRARVVVRHEMVVVVVQVGVASPKLLERDSARDHASSLP